MKTYIFQIVLFTCVATAEQSLARRIFSTNMYPTHIERENLNTQMIRNLCVKSVDVHGLAQIQIWFRLCWANSPDYLYYLFDIFFNTFQDSVVWIRLINPCSETMLCSINQSTATNVVYAGKLRNRRGIWWNTLKTFIFPTVLYTRVDTVVNSSMLKIICSFTCRIVLV